MLSSRGKVNADQLSIPWRFALGTTYHAENNPSGMISFATAEQALVQGELEEFANKVWRHFDLASMNSFNLTSMLNL